MQQNIQELIDKILREGVQKGEEKAQQIVSEAQAAAEKTLADARSEADTIVNRARNEAEELRKKVDSEIRLSGQQAMSGVKQQILDLITAKVVDDGLGATLSSPDVIAELIGALVKNWTADAKGTPDMEVLLPESRRDDLEKAVTGALQGELKKGLTVAFSKGIKGGFQIGPKDASYKISLTDEDFGEFFKSYLRPRTLAFLFGK